MPKGLAEVDLAGRVAFITGGRRGLGRAIALGLGRAGAHVAVTSASPEASELQTELARLGRELFYLQADLADRNQRVGLVDRVVQHFGRIDILINNAGNYILSPLMELPLDEWDRELSLMLTAVFDLSQQAARYMIVAGGGKIVNIASVASFQAPRNAVAYVAAKHGLLGLTRACCAELAPHNINVNAIAPGLFKTDMNDHIFDQPGRAKELATRIPAGRFGDPEDIVGTALFLCSDASRHIHGHTIVVDGGWMAR